MNEGLPWQRQIFEAVPCSIALLMLGFGKLNPPKPLEFSVIELQYRSRRIWQARTKTDRESPCVFLFVRPHIVAWRVAKPSNTRFSAVLRTSEHEIVAISARKCGTSRASRVERPAT